jgi:hypothetical protein
MADLYITHVRYNADETHIDKVMMGSSKESATEQTRSDVVKELDAKKSVETAPPSGSGAQVQKVLVHTIYYIRTDANATAKDNLGNLPRF